MKFEKINDNQVKCFIGAKDLEEKKIKLSELAFGNDKTQQFLKEITERANFEVGFEVGNCPLMIEAVPITEKETILYITKINDNGPVQINKSNGQNPYVNEMQGANHVQKQPKGKPDIYNKAEELKRQLLELVKNTLNSGKNREDKDIKELGEQIISEDFPNGEDFLDENFDTIEIECDDSDDLDFTKEDENYFGETLFESNSLEKMIEVCALLDGRAEAFSTLFYLKNAESYFLRVVPKKGSDRITAIGVDSILTDYLHKCHNTAALTRSLYEHAKIVIPENAIEQLARLK